MLSTFPSASFLATSFLALFVSFSAVAVEQACHVRFKCGSNAIEKMKKFSDITQDKCTTSERTTLSSLLIATAECGTDKRTGVAITPVEIRMVYAYVTTPLNLNLAGRSQVECIKFTRCYPAVGSHWHDPIAYSWIAPAGECSTSESHSSLTRHASNTCKALTNNQNASDQGSSFNHYLYGPFEARFNSNAANKSVAAEAGVRAAGTH